MGMSKDRLTSDLFAPALPPVLLRGATDLDGFRRAARSLLARQVPPDQVAWRTLDAPARGLPPGADGLRAAANADIFSDAPAVKVPAEFLALCERVILHTDPQRWSLLYRLFWRLAHEPGLRHDPLDADRVRAQHLAEAVRHDLHRMEALVRFRSVHDEHFRARPQDGPLHLAWFEPAHHIVEAAAPFFVRRYAQMRWAILTPGRSVEWDCVSPRSRAGALLAPHGQPAGMAGQLRFGPGTRRSDAPPADAGGQRWLTAYRHAFHPGRPKLGTTQQDTPRPPWRGQPQGVSPPTPGLKLA